MNKLNFRFKPRNGIVGAKIVFILPKTYHVLLARAGCDINNYLRENNYNWSSCLKYFSITAISVVTTFQQTFNFLDQHNGTISIEFNIIHSPEIQHLSRTLIQ